MKKLIFVALLGCSSLAFAEQPHGAINTDVTQANINETICVSGWTKTVRPAVSYTNGVKKLLMERQGINWSHAHDYELDHVIPLELGGNPRDPKNLMLQPWDGEWGAHKKDKLENKLKRLVCKGQLSLATAQKDIGSDWIMAYKKYYGE